LSQFERFRGQKFKDEQGVMFWPRKSFKMLVRTFEGPRMKFQAFAQVVIYACTTMKDY